MANQEKRKVPSTIRALLDYDAMITRKFVCYGNQFLPLRSLRYHYKALEITCHGIPWFAFWISFTWLFNIPSLIELQVNMLLGLLTDIILVACLKAYFRRKRPTANTDDALGQMGPDVYSFPSGHASRAVFVVFFFIYLYPMPWWYVPSLVAWCISICISRILMCRHHILDVLAGILLGLCNGCLIGILWISNDTAKWLMSILLDEKFEGADYHV